MLFFKISREIRVTTLWLNITVYIIVQRYIQKKRRRVCIACLLEMVQVWYSANMRICMVTLIQDNVITNKVVP